MSKFRRKIPEPNFEREDTTQRELILFPYRPNDRVLSALRTAKKSLQATSRQSKRNSSNGRGKVTKPGSNAQRVIVKASVVTSKKGEGARKLKAHVNYLARSGVNRSGEEVSFTLKGSKMGSKELKKELSKWNDDPHHFRFIISPARASELDLDSYTKSLVSRISKDLETQLEWFSVAHYNTDNSHIHLIVRGVDEKGKALYINRDYIKHGMREAAQLEATLRLGMEPPSARRKGLIAEATERKLTNIDRRLLYLKNSSKDQTVTLQAPTKGSRELTELSFEASIKRLHFLRELGLATELKGARWKLKENLEQTLYTLGRKQEVEQRLASKLEKNQHLLIHDEKAQLRHTVRGVVLDRGVDNELSDQVYLLISGEDGANHYQVLAKFSEAKGFPANVGEVVEVSPQSNNTKTDRTIIRFSSDNIFDLVSFLSKVQRERELGRWKISSEISTEQYIERYKERLDNLTTSGIVKRIGISKYQVPTDLESQVENLESSLGKKKYVRVKSLSPHGLDAQVIAEGRTWLDELLLKKSPTPDPRTTFGKAVKTALNKREQTLKVRGHQVVQGLLELLNKNEIKKTSTALSSKFGNYVTKDNLGTQPWTISAYKTLSDAHYVVLTQGSKFTLKKLESREERKPLGSKLNLSTPNSIRRRR